MNRFTRRNFGRALCTLILIPCLLLTTACTPANAITILLAGVNAAATIIVPFLTSSAAPVVDQILADTQAAVTEWDGTDTTLTKISVIIGDYSNLATLVSGLSSGDALIIGGVIAAAQAVLVAIQALQPNGTPSAQLNTRISHAVTTMTFSRDDHADLKSLSAQLAATRKLVRAKF
jgi:hypothetical protein